MEVSKGRNKVFCCVKWEQWSQVSLWVQGKTEQEEVLVLTIQNESSEQKVVLWPIAMEHHLLAVSGWKLWTEDKTTSVSEPREEQLFQDCEDSLL
jgi:hypothetical protein